jgi:hypothetical protein
VSDAAIEKARQRREELADKINAHNQALEGFRRELSDVDAFIRAWHMYAGDGQGDPQNENKAEPAEGKKPKATNLPKQIIGAHVESFLRLRGRPALRKEIMAHLREQGITIHGRDPDMVLSTMLWRMPARFQRVQPHGYWLANGPSPGEDADPHTLI